MLLRRWNSVREWRRSLKLRRVRRSYAAKPQLATNSKQTRKNGGGGGSRTPVRKALRAEDYMLSSVQFFSPATLRMSKKSSRLVRWFSPEPYGPKGSSQPAE